MKQISESLKNEVIKARSGMRTNSLRWSDIFGSEEELIEAMNHEKVLSDEKVVPHYKLCRGYQYINSFRTYYKKNGRLTESQMRQLKRLAVELAYQIYC